MLEYLKGYSWVGNIRELKNKIAAYYVFYPHHKSFDLGLLDLHKNDEALSIEIPDTGIDLSGLEKSLIIKALEKSRGNKTKASKLLGISRYSFSYKMDKHQLTTTGYGLQQVSEKIR